MILTLTPNAALDRVLVIDSFQPGTTMRPHQMVDSVGGKGLVTSVALRMLGQETVALSFLAGESGQRLCGLLDGYGIKHHLIWLEGETRLSHVIVETRHHRQSHIIGGVLPVPAEAATDFLEHYKQHLAHARWAVAAGSLPPGLPSDFYQILTEMAQQRGVPILLDIAGAPVAAALAARPTILKMNWDEFEATFEMTSRTLLQLQQQARQVFVRKKLNALVVTCGEQGILAFTPQGAYHAVAPVQQVTSAAGAGDSVSATLAWQIADRAAWSEALRWAAAVSAAAVLTEKTAEFSMADVERLRPQITVEEL